MGYLAGQLPAAFAALMAWTWIRSVRAGPRGWDRVGSGVIAAALATGAWVVLGTEALGLGRSLKPAAVLWWWATPCVLAAAWLVLSERRRGARSRAADLDRDSSTNPPSWRVPGTALAMWAVVGVGMIAALAVGIAGAPNTWDVMDYHLPRQVQWALQGTVDHFQTWDTRLTAMPPLAEFAGLHLLLLTGGDRLATLPQWGAMLVTVVAAAMITTRLGGKADTAAAAALIAFTIPCATMQATNVKNDLVLTACVMVLTLLGLSLWVDRRLPWGRIVAIGLALGLTLLSKGTGIIFGGVLMAGVGLAALRTLGARAIPLVLAATVLAGAINTPHWVRNTRAFGGPLSSAENPPDWGVGNTSHAPWAVASNVVRNIAMHAAWPSPSWNAKVTRWIGSLHEAAGIALNDPRTTFLESEPFRPQGLPTHEDMAVAPVHVAAALVAVVLAMFRGWMLRLYALALVLMYVGFCAALKWQPWHPRLHLPMLAVASPLIAAMITWRWACTPMLAAAIYLAGHGLVNNFRRPMVGPNAVWTKDRMQLLYLERRELEQPTREVVARVRELTPKLVGIHSGRTSALYPLQLLMREAVPQAKVSIFRWDRQSTPWRRVGQPDVAVISGTKVDTFLDEQTSVRYFVDREILPYRIFLRSDHPLAVPRSPESR